MAKREKEEDERADESEDEREAASTDDDAREADAADDDATKASKADEDAEDEDDADEDDADEDDEDDADEDDADEKAASKDDDEESEEEEQEEKSASDADDDDSKSAEDADAASEAGDESTLPTQLGAQRYVLAAFFAGSLLFAYLLGRAIDGVWQALAHRDWLVERAPVVASISDDDKGTYSTVAAGAIALVLAIRTSRKPEVKQWGEEVSGELLKVKWPTRKEVYASTVVVLATSAIAVVYLFLLDRFWGFVTNKIYGG